MVTNRDIYHVIISIIKIKQHDPASGLKKREKFRYFDWRQGMLLMIGSISLRNREGIAC